MQAPWGCGRDNCEVPSNKDRVSEASHRMERERMRGRRLEMHCQEEIPYRP